MFINSTISSSPMKIPFFSLKSHGIHIHVLLSQEAYNLLSIGFIIGLFYLNII